MQPMRNVASLCAGRGRLSRTTAAASRPASIEASAAMRKTSPMG